ncbi:putative protein 6 [Kallithea virus]|uniref:ORF6 n=1 Tax=Kallithea virus TaxID=1654582 RepID=A0A0F7KNJ9_9VIRU|nr:putative protein 6 [Kallithea virus]AKH40357.1 ORF6 [Kallithea virus]AQN78557.1 putative protein 6 [Kallithea virus]
MNDIKSMLKEVLKQKIKPRRKYKKLNDGDSESSDHEEQNTKIAIKNGNQRKIHNMDSKIQTVSYPTLKKIYTFVRIQSVYVFRLLRFLPLQTKNNIIPEYRTSQQNYTQFVEKSSI